MYYKNFYSCKNISVYKASVFVIPRLFHPILIFVSNSLSGVPCTLWVGLKQRCEWAVCRENAPAMNSAELITTVKTFYSTNHWLEFRRHDTHHKNIQHNDTKH
jgi:hypothetical protein